MRYRLSALQRLLVPSAGGVFAAILIELMLWTHDEALLAGPALEAILIGLGCGVLNLTVSAGYGVTLTKDELIIHNEQRRSVPWDVVERIGTERFMGARTIVLRETTGRRTRLRAPIGTLDRRFDEKVRTIETWWHEHDGSQPAR